ncbi:hypothetical protein [Streptococcus massiliensis]
MTNAIYFTFYSFNKAKGWFPSLKTDLFGSIISVVGKITLGIMEPILL